MHTFTIPISRWAILSSENCLGVQHFSLIYYVDTNVFAGKYTSRKIHPKLHPGPEWSISISSLVRVLMTSFPAFS